MIKFFGILHYSLGTFFFLYFYFCFYTYLACRETAIVRVFCLFLKKKWQLLFGFCEECQFFLLFFSIFLIGCNARDAEKAKNIICLCESYGWDKRKMTQIPIVTLDKKTLFLGSSINTLLDNYNSKFWRIHIKESYFPESLASTDWRLKCKGDRVYERLIKKNKNYFSEKFIFVDSLLIRYELELAIYSKKRIENYAELSKKSKVSLPHVLSEIRFDKDTIFVNNMLTVEYEQYYEPKHQEFHSFLFTYSYDYEKLQYWWLPTIKE